MVGDYQIKGEMSEVVLFWVKTAENNCKNCKVSDGSLRWRSGARTWSGGGSLEGQNGPGIVLEVPEVVLEVPEVVLEVPEVVLEVPGPLKMLFLRVLGGQKMSPERGFEGYQISFTLDAVSPPLLFNRPITFLDRSKGEMSQKH